MNDEIYCFDPLKHGFEPIQNYPELEFAYPIIDGYFVKIVCYDNYGGLVYWYKVISTLVGLKPDDRVEITYGVYDFRKSKYERQSNPKVEYLGLISSDQFAEFLMKNYWRSAEKRDYNINLGNLNNKPYANRFQNHYMGTCRNRRCPS